MMAMAKVNIGYARPEVLLRRPWYVWAGAVMATGWLAVVGVATVWGSVRVCMDHHAARVEPVTDLALLLLALLIVTMVLVLEWRAIFRCSANASAMVGLVFAMVACLALLAEAQAVLRHRNIREIASIGAIAAVLCFCAWAHFRWAALIAAWLTHSIEAAPRESVSRECGGRSGVVGTRR